MTIEHPPADPFEVASRSGWEVVAHEHMAAFWVLGNCMSPDGISDGDIVLVDTDRRPEHGDIGAFFLSHGHGRTERLLKRLDLSDGMRLVSSNPAYAPIEIEDERDLLMVGTVIAFVHPEPEGGSGG